MPDAEVKLGELLSLLKIQESLLQSYRRIFISTQSVLIAVAAGVAFAVDRELAAFFALGIMFLVAMYLNYLHIKVCGLRGKAVYFVQWLILRFEQGIAVNRPLTYMKEYLNSGKYEGINVVDDEGYNQLTGAASAEEQGVRKPLNSLPWVFVVLWLLLVLLRIIIAFINVYG